MTSDSSPPPSLDGATQPSPPDPVVLLDVSAVRRRYGWIRDDRAARRIIKQAGGRIVAGRWAVPLDLLERWERAWHRPRVARQADKTPARAVDTSKVDTADIPAQLPDDWWRK